MTRLFQRRYGALLAVCAALCLGACASALQVTPAALADLAPGGKLRAVINQAMGMRLGRGAGAKYPSAFVEEVKASGFVAEALRGHAIEGAAVAPVGVQPN